MEESRAEKKDTMDLQKDEFTTLPIEEKLNRLNGKLSTMLRDMDSVQDQLRYLKRIVSILITHINNAD